MIKKRGTSGLKNLQIARRKKMMRRERMRKLAEKRKKQRLTKIENAKTKIQHKTLTKPVYEVSNDYFLGNRTENVNEKIVIALRLTSLMKHLQDGTTLTKHSIRDAKTYPIFNRIKNFQELLNPDNPIFWSCSQVQIFIEQFTSQKGIMKRFKCQEIDGEALLNISRTDLSNYFEIDSSTADALGGTLEQLKKETVLRYVNS